MGDCVNGKLGDGKRGGLLHPNSLAQKRINFHDLLPLCRNFVLVNDSFLGIFFFFFGNAFKTDLGL